MGVKTSDFSVALPYGDRHGWGIAGAKIADGLTRKGASITCRVDQGDGYGPSKRHLLQAITGVDFDYASRLISDGLNVGYGFIENDIQAKRYTPRARRLWDHIICGSTWMKDWLSEQFNHDRLSVAIQGVDPEVFNYQEVPRDTDWFTVGSFGKFEYRKGQDIVIRAMKRFCERHKDVRLLHQWGNDWPQSAAEMGHIPGTGFPKFDPNQNMNEIRTGDFFKAYMDAIGIPNENVGRLPNNKMANIYRRCDVALFPTRCEGGQALPFQESLACGVPCIVSDATGHQDITEDCDYPCSDLLLRGGKDFVHKLGDVEIGNWYAPCEDYVQSQLEYAYRTRKSLEYRRHDIAEFGKVFTWNYTVEQFDRILNGLSY